MKKYNESWAAWLEKKAIDTVNNMYGHLVKDKDQRNALITLDKERKILNDYIDGYPDCEFEIYALCQINVLRGQIHDKIDRERVKKYAANLLPGSNT